MQSVLTAFPKRRVAIRNSGHQNSQSILAVMFLGILIVLLGLSQIPGIYHDIHIDGQWEPESDASAEGHCTGKIVLWMCDVRMASSAGNARSSYFMYFGSQPISKITVVHEKNNPAMLTSGWNIELLWQRIFSVATLLVISLPVTLAMFFNWRSGRELRGLINRGRSAQVSPIVVKIKHSQPWWQVGESEHVWFSFSGHFGKDRCAGISAFDQGELPFLLGDTATALAVKLPGSVGVILLDEKLSRLALSEDEREAVYAARGHKWETAG